MAESFKRSMPSCRLVQIKDEKSPTVDHVDEVLVRAYNGNMMLYLLRGFAKIEWDDVLITTADDCIVERSFLDEVEGDFDVAIVRREGMSFAARNFPYTNGLVIVKHKDFYKDCAIWLDDHKDEVLKENRLGDWWGDMAAIREVLNSGKYRIKLLDKAKYFKKPLDRGDGGTGATLWHYSGERKDWMQDHRYAL